MFNRRRARRERVPAPSREHEQLRRFLEDARNFTGFEEDDVPGMRLRTNPGERVFICVHGVLLFEARDDVIDLVEPPAIDRGEFVVTATRAVFTGTKQIRQWIWADLARVDHDEGPWTSIVVSSRARQFGVLYDDQHRDEIRFSIDLGVATAQGTREALIRRISAELESLEAPRVR